MARYLTSVDMKYLSRGIFSVNKIKNYTCAEIVDIIKEVLFKEVRQQICPAYLKVGHGGTLDHTATGVLVIGTGLGCKILPKLLHGSKKYYVVGHLGIATDTFNEVGTTIKHSSYSHITRQMLESELTKFQGKILQTPPLYSALKIQGQRASDLTRAGIPLKLNPRPVICHSIKCVDFSPPSFTLEVHCEGGFYVRSLINDLGNSLDSCAHVQQLHRFEHGPFTEEDMLDHHQWTVDNILTAIREARFKYNDFLKDPKKRKKMKWSEM